MRWEDLTEGTVMEPLELPAVTRTDIVRYQGASGDMNPVHHDEPFARAAGYPAPLGVGMYQAGALAAWAADWLGPEQVRRVKLRWKEPVFPGDVLRLEGKVAKRWEEGGARFVELALQCAKKGGGIAVEATAVFAIS
jgi:acyl dehydratase